jgi:hypothetical protein
VASWKSYRDWQANDCKYRRYPVRCQRNLLQSSSPARLTSPGPLLTSACKSLRCLSGFFTFAHRASCNAAILNFARRTHLCSGADT